ncbi:MAG TPA: hypothetical protein VLB04_11055 [Methanotrichaceae archaeon]|nr:hypothetical protein [Methanotrichaceae archaeon]
MQGREADRRGVRLRKARKFLEGGESQGCKLGRPDGRKGAFRLSRGRRLHTAGDGSYAQGLNV